MGRNGGRYNMTKHKVIMVSLSSACLVKPSTAAKRLGAIEITMGASA